MASGLGDMHLEKRGIMGWLSKVMLDDLLDTTLPDRSLRNRWRQFSIKTIGKAEIMFKQVWINTSRIESTLGWYSNQHFFDQQIISINTGMIFHHLNITKKDKELPLLDSNTNCDETSFAHIGTPSSGRRCWSQNWNGSCWMEPGMKHGLHYQIKSIH